MNKIRYLHPKQAQKSLRARMTFFDRVLDSVYSWLGMSRFKFIAMPACASLGALHAKYAGPTDGEAVLIPKK